MSWLWDEISGLEFMALLMDAGVIGGPEYKPPSPQPMSVEVIRRDGKLFCGACGRVEIYQGNNRCRPCYREYVRWKERLRHERRSTQTHLCPCGATIAVQARLCRPCKDIDRRRYWRDYYHEKLSPRKLHRVDSEPPSELAS